MSPNRVTQEIQPVPWTRRHLLGLEDLTLYSSA